MSQCARPGCPSAANRFCSVCLREPYCSSNCQKADWKEHKPICKTLKTLSNNLQPYNDVSQIIIGILHEAPVNIRKNVRVLIHLLSYTKLQFGDQIPGKTYRERGGHGDRISNWRVEIELLLQVSYRLVTIISGDESQSVIIRDNMMMPFLERQSEILKPYSALLDLGDSSFIKQLGREPAMQLLLVMIETDHRISRIHTNRYNFDSAEFFAQRSLFYAKKYEGKEETKAVKMYLVYTNYCNLRMMQINYLGAVSFAEEAYNAVAEAYNPVHAFVLSAAGCLIECLIHTGNIYDAERYGQATLDCLRDPANGVDQEGDDIAQGYHNLGKVLSHPQHKLNIEKAERLSREAYRIRVKLYGNDHRLVGLTASVLAKNLNSQGKSEDETMKLYKQSLAIHIRNEGPDGQNTAIGNMQLSLYHSSLTKRQETVDLIREHLYLAISYMKEAVRISTKNYGSNNPQVIQNSELLLGFTRILSQIDE